MDGLGDVVNGWDAARQPWTQLPDHYPGGSGLPCPVDGEPWPCRAEGDARGAYLAEHIAAKERARGVPDALRAAAEAVVLSALTYSSEEMFGVYPVGLFGHIGKLQEALAADSLERGLADVEAGRVKPWSEVRAAILPSEPRSAP